MTTQECIACDKKAVNEDGTVQEGVWVFPMLGRPDSETPDSDEELLASLVCDVCMRELVGGGWKPLRIPARYAPQQKEPPGPKEEGKSVTRLR